MIDPFGRRINYLRVSVTDRCNFRCDYCMPKQGYHPEGNHKEYLTFEEIKFICDAFADLGTNRIRITGGEPLVRKNIPELVAMLNSNKKISDISLSTNGHKLKKHTKDLYRAGLKRVNVSLDSLDPIQFKEITRGGDINKVLEGISAAVEAKLSPVKLNMVVMSSNFSQIPDMIDYAIQVGATLRFIEVMPIGQPGIEKSSSYISAEAIKKEVCKHLQGSLHKSNEILGGGPATYYDVKSKSKENIKVGIISAISEQFCAGCNRVRLNSKGRLILCLGQENSVNLLPYIRNDISFSGLKKLILEAISKKPERHFFNENIHNITFRQMSAVGG